MSFLTFSKEIASSGQFEAHKPHPKQPSRPIMIFSPSESSMRSIIPTGQISTPVSHNAHK